MTINKDRLEFSTESTLRTDYVQFWSKCNQPTNKQTSKMLFYSTISILYILQPYFISPWTNKKALSKLRISAHDLMTERGGYLNISLEQRLCDACNKIEDKLHFLDKCIKSNQMRSQLSKTITVELASNVTKSIDLLFIQ